MMSSEKGNASRRRPQKHQNRTAFKNDLHDTSARTKAINGVQPVGLCARCADIVRWKIKYKKYKPLASAATCVRCGARSVLRAYHAACQPCANALDVCAKCLRQHDQQTKQVKVEVEVEDDDDSAPTQRLTERKRRTLLRQKNKKRDDDGDEDRESVDDDE